MTPEQEDALVESSIADATIRTGAVSVNFDFRDAIRLAIRAVGAAWAAAWAAAWDAARQQFNALVNEAFEEYL